MGSMNDLLFKFNAPPNVNLPIFFTWLRPRHQCWATKICITQVNACDNLHCTVFIDLYSAYHSMSLQEAIPTTALIMRRNLFVCSIFGASSIR